MPLMKAKERSRFGTAVDAVVDTDDIETATAVTLNDIWGNPLPDSFVEVTFRKTRETRTYFGTVDQFLPGGADHG